MLREKITLQRIDLLTSKGANPNDMDQSKWSPLTWGSQGKSGVAASKMLIAKGADVNHEDSEGTPFAADCR